MRWGCIRDISDDMGIHWGCVRDALRILREFSLSTREFGFLDNCGIYKICEANM